MRLRGGESLWMVLAADESPARWSVQAAERALDETAASWRKWLSRFDLRGEHAEQLARSLRALHLLGYAPSGAVVAAPTLGMPERIGGPRNYDYRYAWVRDASLSVTGLSLAGDTDTAGRYLEWLSRLGSRTDAPLQVAYDVHGRTKIEPHRWRGALGYFESSPVTRREHARIVGRQEGRRVYAGRHRAPCWRVVDLAGPRARRARARAPGHRACARGRGHRVHTAFPVPVILVNPCSGPRSPGDWRAAERSA